MTEAATFPRLPSGDDALAGSSSVPPPDGIVRVDQIVSWWAARTPDHRAVSERDGTWTYAELAAAIEAARRGLAADGVRPGDRVMIVGENCRALVAVMIAAAGLDAWPAVVNARLSDREIDEISEHCGARRIIYTVQASPRGRAHAARHGAVAWNIVLPGSLAIGPLATAGAAEPVAADEGERVAALVYTSGTTGRSKGVMLTHRNLLFTARTTGSVRGLSTADIVYAVLPASHALGLAGMVYGTLYYGGALHLASRFDPASFLAAVTHQGVTVAVSAPAMFALLIEYLRAKQIPTIANHTLRLASSAGAPLDLELKRSFERVFGIPLHNGYGVSECSPTVTQTRLAEVRQDCSVGRVLPGVDVRLVDADGREVAGGDVGELLVRGPNVMKGYFREPALTAAIFTPDGWLRTSDLARFEGEHLFIVARSTEMIVRFGFKVYPPEIEAVLNAHPAVVLSAVVGRPGELDDDIVAFVQSAPGSTLDAQDLMSYAAQYLSSYKQPSHIVFVDELPTSAPGKIRKGELANLVAAIPAARR